MSEATSAAATVFDRSGFPQPAQLNDECISRLSIGTPQLGHVATRDIGEV